MVKAWREKVVIPTYEIGTAEKNPIFLEKRVYQGSSGVVYPYPVVEKISDTKEDKAYNAIFIENEYLKIMILPELGGRIQMAYDKIKNRHFIYYNQVIKPALVGLAGPWISGGIEFNWPQHHRPSTFLPVDSFIEEFEDGSVTVWLSEMEKMFHQKGMAGITLYPGKAYMEIKGKLYNRTSVPQTFLWWANPAVSVNDYYQSVFPPDVNAVFDHGKRDVSTFPIATGTYYKVDYSAGVDISNYKNIPVPTSYMAIKSKYNFVGGYENDTKAGVLHVANHHVSPGKKQWTWGNGDFGHAWDRNLTDEDGPYIELMTGVFTDNQPDFSWLQPYEEKSFTQYFLPYRELGVVKNASKDFLININEIEDGIIQFKIFATSENEVNVVLKNKSNVVYNETKVVSPLNILEETLNVKDSLDNCSLFIYDKSGHLVLSWLPESKDIKPTPDAAKAALSPMDTQTVEQLYLTGLHLEQYRHATYNPADYYLEGLRREPKDYRCNNAMGLLYFRKGRFDIAEKYLKTAIETIIERNPNPYDGEPLYNLGQVLKFEERYDEAYENFYKATWNAAWKDAGFFNCAQISMIQNRYEDALEEIDASLVRNWHNHKARALKASVLRLMGRNDNALKIIDESLELDRFNYGAMYEKYLITEDKEILRQLMTMMRKSSQNYEEIALDYASMGLYEDAVNILKLAVSEQCEDPMTYYFMALYTEYLNQDSSSYLNLAKSASPNYCFPNRLEAIKALVFAIENNKSDAKAPYYLGNLYYDKRQYDLARKNWELSVERDPAFPTVLRNLSLIYFNKCNMPQKAVDALEKAFILDKTDSRILMELDQLYKRIHRPFKQRYDFLSENMDLVEQRDDLYLEMITLLNQLGEYAKAKDMLDSRVFHPWEGGEGKVPAQYQLSRVELAKKMIKDKNFVSAIKLLEECLVYPAHLGEGKLIGAQDNDFYYFLGCAYEGLGDNEKAKDCWLKAKQGLIEPAAAIFYNDQKPDKIFYQGLSCLKLNQKDEANSRFYKLINYGEKHLYDIVKMDYFAVSLPDLQIWDGDLTLANQVHCNYMLALGNYGLGKNNEAMAFLDKAESINPEHQGIQTFKSWISNVS